MESRFSSVLLVDSSVSRRFPRFDLKIRADLTQFTNTSVAHIKKPLALAFLTHLAIVLKCPDQRSKRRQEHFNGTFQNSNSNLDAHKLY